MKSKIREDFTPLRIRALRMRLSELDAAHMRAQTPTQRRHIEKEIDVVENVLRVEREEFAKLQREGAENDAPFLTALELELTVLQRTNPEVKAALDKYEKTVDKILKRPWKKKK